jgi:hypothetical protein
MDDTCNAAAVDHKSLEAEDLEDGIDYEEIHAATQADFEAGRFAFNSADYASEEDAEAALWKFICAVGKEAREAVAARHLDANREK